MTTSPSMSTRLPSLAVAIVTHNATEWLPGLAQSWREALARAGVSAVPTYIADSGSTDDTRELAATLFPEASVIECGNIGFGAAANRAINRSNEEWILLVNPDITVPPEFVASVADLLAQPASAGAYVPRLLNPDGSPQPSVGRFPTLLGLLRDQFRPRPQRKYLPRQPEAPTEIDWAMGACLLLHRERVRSVGGFDERFFLYVEEVDLLRRMARQGHPCVFVPSLRVVHHHPDAARPPRPQVQRYAARGLLRYFAKHASWPRLRAYALLALLSGRLSPGEALARRRRILRRATGP